MKLAEMTTFEVDRLPRDIVVMLPIASLEQHSKHLPVFTDSLLVGAVAEGVEAKLPKDVLLLPVQWAGASDHHLGFPGTASLSVDTHTDVLEQLLRSFLRHGFTNLVLLNGHGGNDDTMHMALRRLMNDYPQAHLAAATYWHIAADTIAKHLAGPLKRLGHACEAETSLIMAVRPDLVRKNLLHDDPPQDDDRLNGVYVPLDMKLHTHRGEIGYATHSDAARGKLMLKAIIADVTKSIAAIRKGATRGSSSSAARASKPRR